MTDPQKAYFEAIAAQICGDLESVQTIKKFADNTAVIGAYAEVKVMALMKRLLHPLRVSTGTIISPETFSSPKDRPQMDTIVWDCNPLPTVMTEGDFGLVPRNSVVGAMEIKRNDYSAGLDDIGKRSEAAETELPSGKQGFMGIVCVCDAHDPNGSNKLSNLIADGSAVYLIDMRDETIRVNTKGVLDLVNYASRLRKFHKEWSSEFSVTA